MRVRVEIYAAGGEQPPAGSPVLVQVLDTALQDVEATVLAETRGFWSAQPVVEIDTPEAGDISVHVDVDRDGKVSDGDFITMQSYPCRGGEMRVEVRKV